MIKIIQTLWLNSNNHKLKNCIKLYQASNLLRFQFSTILDNIAQNLKSEDKNQKNEKKDNQLNDQLTQQNICTLMDSYSEQKDWSSNAIDQQIELQNILSNQFSIELISQDTILVTLNNFIKTQIINLRLLEQIQTLLVKEIIREDICRKLLTVFAMLPVHIKLDGDIRIMLNNYVMRKWKTLNNIGKIQILIEIYKIENLTDRPRIEQLETYSLIDSQLLSDINHFIYGINIQELSTQHDSLSALVFLMTYYKDKYQKSQLGKLISQSHPYLDLKQQNTDFHQQVKRQLPPGYSIIENYVSQSVFLVNFKLDEDKLLDLIDPHSYIILSEVKGFRGSSVSSLRNNSSMFETRTTSLRVKILQIFKESIMKTGEIKYIKLPQMEWERWRLKNNQNKALEYLLKGYKITDLRELF